MEVSLAVEGDGPIVPLYAQLHVNGSAVSVPHQHDAVKGAELRVRLCATSTWGGEARKVNLTYGGRVQTLVVTPQLAPASCPDGSYRRSSSLDLPTAGQEGGAAGEEKAQVVEWCAKCPAGTYHATAHAAASSSSSSSSASRAAIVASIGVMACRPCPMSHVSGEGSTSCVSCGSVYNSNPDNTACTVRWYVYAGGGVAIFLVAGVLATAQTLFRFGNRQVERLMWQAREARRLAREQEKRSREKIFKKKARKLGNVLSGGGGGGGDGKDGDGKDGDGDGKDGDDEGDSSSDEDEDTIAVNQEVSSTMDMVLAEAAISTTALAAVDAMAASAAASASVLVGVNRRQLLDDVKDVVHAQKAAVEAAAFEATAVGRSWPVVQATKHALGEISVAVMREADAELIDVLAAAVAAAPKNSFQAMLLANRLSNAKFVLSNKSNGQKRASTPAIAMASFFGHRVGGAPKNIGAKNGGDATLGGSGGGAGGDLNKAADPSARFALMALPEELNECANRHSRGAESEVTLSALGLRDDVEDAAVAVEAEQIADAHLGAARVQLARMVMRANAAANAALRVAGKNGSGGGWGALTGGAGDDAAAAAAGATAASEQPMRPAAATAATTGPPQPGMPAAADREGGRGARGDP